MGNIEIPNWIKALPLAPVYRPTYTEFADPIAYISKIEKEASAFGICKIIPPLPKPSKKYVFYNLNKSLLRCPEFASGVDISKVCQEDRAVFTTRQQELGQAVKRTKGGESSKSHSQRSGVKQVWQSGGVFTLEQFESKSKTFYKSQLGTIKEVSPVVVEALFWKAALERPMYIEYANDVPGSAFAEPEGHFRHFRQRKRRGRGSYQRKAEINEDSRVENRTGGNNSQEPSRKNGEKTLPEVAKASLASPSLLPQDSSKQKNMDFVDEMEGTAGWKLSNSSWNLQTIARSPGSVTRFMPDDIPGVTSPMVYIGMLFSWFAWHVEDHELHSMNYLHTGSPKTWYAVPGDYAFDFEEVIRKNSYGRNIDQLAALTQLGEKTTLVSPEMIVASGIPCCRLVQHPGEFVVTFPRSYHVGFSHGFNCGEAANFGTPQWLNVAKEAAVRRAAMNYLPMLSHQQLLYLLAMSFVSRVPRSLLPGGRSSRLRDRQREEREFLVKKAFVEDILNENKNLSVLLREPGSRLVMWDPYLLPHHSAIALSAAGGAAASAVLPPAVAKNELEEGHSELQNKEKTTLLEELSLFMEKLNDVYYDDDDGLLNDFQVDSGTLACVACGVLGFPFMSVVQPSEKALKDLSERQGKIDAQEITTLSSEKSECEWNTSSRYIRPRIFCLEHTIELNRLLQSRGGLKFLVICHKDFQKFKAHAAIVAEEVKVPFSYDDVLLESASQEELSLIDLAIEDEENYEHGVDWTSELGINLRYCVKVRNNSPTKKIQHALSLGGLFSDTSHLLDISTTKWLQRKSRSKAKPISTSSFTSREHLEVKVDGKIGKNLDSQVGGKEEKIIQYSRKKKLNPKPSREQDQELATLAKSQTFNKLANRSPLDSAIRSEMNDEIGDSERDSRRNEVSFSENPFSSSFTGAHGQEHSEITIKFGSALDGNVTNSCSMVNKDSAELTSVSREHQGGSNSDSHVVASQTVLVSTGDNHNGPRKLSGDYVYNGVSVRGVQEAVEISDQEFEEPRSTVTNIEDVQQSQMVQPTKREAVSSDHAHVEGAEAVCTRQNLRSEIILHTEHSSAQMGIPEINTASENITVEMTHDGEPLASSNILSSSNADQASSNGLQAPDDELSMDSKVSSPEDTEVIEAPNSMGEAKKKRKIESGSETNDNPESRIGFIRSPCEGLRSRGKRKATCETSDEEKKPIAKRLKKTPKTRSGSHHQEVPTTTHHNRCYLEGCKMTFESKVKLQAHQRNRCTHEGCGKKFRAHKYLVLHQRVHNDDRPFGCPWKGCSMTFKWQWARTEHLRLHTGERPYKCKVEECGLSFRFVSDYSRHRRKTGHYVA